MGRIVTTSIHDEYDNVFDIEVEAMTRDEIINFMSDKNPNAFQVDFGDSILLEYSDYFFDDEYMYYLDSNSNTIIELHNIKQNRRKQTMKEF